MSREEQFNLEIQHDTAAAAARLASLRAAAASGDLSAPRAARLVMRMHSEVEEVLRGYCEATPRGNGAKYRAWIRALPLDLAAVISVRACIKACSERPNGVTVQELASAIGKQWETEVRIREAEAVNPLYVQRVHDQVRTNASQNVHHLRRLYNAVYDRVMKGEIDTSLSSSELVQIGKHGVQACLQAGLIEARTAPWKKGRVTLYSLPEEITEFLHGYTEDDVKYLVDRKTAAMVCPPDPWTNIQDGGYLSLRRKHAAPLVRFGRGQRPERRRELREELTAEKCPEVFAAGNYLQAHAFRVHKPTVQAIRRVWEAGGGVLGVPTKEGPQKPVLALPEAWEKELGTPEELAVFKGWKIQMRHYYTARRKWGSKVLELSSFLYAADLHDRAIWFPVHADTRGRWYYRGAPNPQGSDMARGSLHFNEKKPLGKAGVFWLKVHIANSLGFDKARFVDRARYTEQRWEALERALEAPEDSVDVWGTDAPWCAYSAVWELREAYRSGSPETYCSGVVVHMDATASGLQIFSAMLRDPVGARYVNLLDDAKCGPKQDLYAQVAANALAVVKLEQEHPDEEIARMARWWIQAGVPRALAKKPCMTFTYGATLRGTARHIEDTVHLTMPEVALPEGSEGYRYCLYMARKLFEGIEGTVPAAAEAMRWLKGITKQQAGKPLRWKSPSGFPVVHEYAAVQAKRVHIRSCGQVSVLVYNLKEGADPTKMRNAVSPNFVHALDAAHLTKTALRMQAAGLSMVGIHDSFGTHAGDVPEMHEHIREAFVQMYEHKNVLGEFLCAVGGVGEPPPRGTLDIARVRDSEFFFC